LGQILIKIIKLFILIIILSSIVVWISDNPGNVEITLRNYFLQTNMIGISLLLILIIGSTLFISRLFGTIKNFPKTFRLNRKARNLALTNESLDKLAENILLGDSENIEKETRKVRKYLKNDFFSAYMLFNNCLIKNDFKGAQRYLNILHTLPKNKYVANRASVILLHKSKKIEDTKKLLLELCKDNPEDIWFHEKLSKIYATERDWKKAFELIENFRSIPNDLQDYKAQLIILTGGEPYEAINLSNNSVIIVNETIKYYLKESKVKKASEIIDKTWDKLMYLDLIKTFMNSNLKEEKEKLLRYKLISKVLRKRIRKNSNETMLALAYASSVASIWGESQSYLDKINKNEWDERMLELFRNISNEVKGLKITEPKKLFLTEPKWTCSVCKYQDNEWNLVCTNCDSINSISWPKSVKSEKNSSELFNELLQNPLRHLPKMKSQN